MASADRALVMLVRRSKLSHHDIRSSSAAAARGFSDLVRISLALWRQRD